MSQSESKIEMFSKEKKPQIHVIYITFQNDN